jgi:hypothetical protein
VRDIRADRRFEGRDPGEAHVHRGQPFRERLVRRVVTLHVPDHKADAAALGGPHELDALLLGVAKGLLHEHALAGRDRRRGDRGMAAVRRDQNGIHRRFDDGLPPNELAGFRKQAASGPPRLLGEVAHRDHLEVVVQLPQMR